VVRLVPIMGALAALLTFTGLQQQMTDDILGHLEKGLQGIEDYTVHLQAAVDMERLQVPSMEALMYYKSPGKIHFESSSFAMLPREGLAFNPSDLRQNYEGEYLGADTLDGLRCLVVRLKPRSDEMRMRLLTLWVDSARWVVTQMRAQPFEGRKVTARFSYIRVGERFWLPETLVVTLETTDAVPEGGVSLPGAAPEAQRHRQALRQGAITVVYSNYVLNSGLKDELFEERKERQ